MTPTLYILRHAKSGHDNPLLADFDRPLNERGRREAEEVAEFVRKRGYRPARIVCSSAQRTRETLTPLLAVLTADATVEFTRQVYDAGYDGLLELIRGQPDDAASVLLVGHNPGLEDLARTLAESGDGTALARLRLMFPPASFAALSFDGPGWRDIGPGKGRLETFETPA